MSPFTKAEPEIVILEPDRVSVPPDLPVKALPVIVRVVRSPMVAPADAEKSPATVRVEVPVFVPIPTSGSREVA
tara:strand:- start:48 stop:269 length:222 start_codon:yes stop_codon:yes gene_type:complete